MQLTDSALNSEALVIKSETVVRANTAVRIGTMLQDIIDSKINNDRISTDPALGTSNTLVPSQAAVRSYVNGRTLNDILTAGNTSSLEIGVGAINLGVGSSGRVTFNSDIFTFLDSLPNDIFSIKDGELNILSSAGTIISKISSSSVTASRTFNLPNNSGTFAMTSDLTPFELLSNKSIDGTLVANSDTLYPSQKAVKTYVDGKTPKRFIALISQTGSADPALTLPYIRNDFSGTISVVRNNVGDYTVINTLPEFIANKTSVCINNSVNSATKFTGATRTLDTTVNIVTHSLVGGGPLADGQLNLDTLVIEVYP